MDRHEDPAPARGQPRLLDQVRGVIRRLHYSIRTEQAYVDLDPWGESAGFGGRKVVATLKT